MRVSPNKIAIIPNPSLLYAMTFLFLLATVGDVYCRSDKTTTKPLRPTSFVFVLLYCKEQPYTILVIRRVGTVHYLLYPSIPMLSDTEIDPVWYSAGGDGVSESRCESVLTMERSHGDMPASTEGIYL